MKSSIQLALLSAIAVLTFNQAAKAGILLEPYLGYVVSGQAKTSSTSNYKGTVYGARVGYSVLNFAVGAEYAATSFTDDSSPQQTITGGDLGLFGAFTFPVLVRAYATYIPSPILKASSVGPTITYKSGNIIKLGVGFTVLPLVNIGLEYTTGTYSKVDFGGPDFNLLNNLNTTSYALVVSVPITL